MTSPRTLQLPRTVTGTACWSCADRDWPGKADEVLALARAFGALGVIVAVQVEGDRVVLYGVLVALEDAHA